MSAVDSDSSLLFGMLAIQNGLIEPPDLIAAFQSWCEDQSREMADFLVEHGAMNENGRAMIDGLIRRLVPKQPSPSEEFAGTVTAPGSVVDGGITREAAGPSA